jgi:flagellar basal-body rod modification protein FlgD
MITTSSVNTTTGAQTGSTSTASSQEMNKDDFLKLLMTQLKNQDPLQPMDTNQISSQLAQFSSIEQLVDIKNLLQTSSDSNAVLTQTMYNSLATNMIGKEIKGYTNDIQYDGSTAVKFGFSYPTDAKTVTVSILDSNGKVVKSYKDSFTTGDNTISWDGTDNSGNAVQSGAYTIKIDAQDSSGTALTVQPYTFGKITSIRYKDGESYVVVNGVEIDIKNLTEIYGGS